MKSIKRVPKDVSGPDRKRVLITAEASLYKQLKIRMVEEERTISQWFEEQATQYLKRKGI
jgi:hypothetical protein